MRNSFGIKKKMWLGISILMVGYLFSMVFGSILGKQTENRLTVVSNSAFPAAQYSRTAFNAFKEQIKAYSDAVIFGDAALISQAGEKHKEAMSAFEQILALEGLSQKVVEDVTATTKQLQTFSADATRIYSSMTGADTDMAENAEDKVAALAKTTSVLRDRLSSVSQTLADNLRAELAAISDASQKQRHLNLMVFLAVVISTMAVVSWILTRFVGRPMQETVVMFKDIADGEGDLTRRLQIKSKDEMGELAHWFNLFMDNMQTMLKRVSVEAQKLKQSSIELSSLSGQMTQTAENVSGKSGLVATASDEMSSNIYSVAEFMEEMSTNVNLVATAIEEMTSTVNEIAQNSEKAKTITDDAVAQAGRASVQIGELGNTAHDIGNVVETITEISEQTNLLALNATIEAARAGEAGKGFAVVANEIKELARQTAEATLQVKRQIHDIQTSTNSTVGEITQISRVIAQVNDIVTAIASAVEEQSVTASEIAGNVSKAANGVNEVTKSITHNSTATGKIAKDISIISTAADDMSGGSVQVNASATSLKDMAEELNTMVGRFRL